MLFDSSEDRHGIYNAYFILKALQTSFPQKSPLSFLSHGV